MIVFISGGCKNGKSMLAQHLTKRLCADGRLYYIATMIPHDSEDEERIKRHVADRAGWGYNTIECGHGILECLHNADKNGTFLLDSVTALLSNEMFSKNGIDYDAPERVAQELEKLSKAVGNIVLVSDFVYADADQYDELSEKYRRGLAMIDKKLAEISDTVVEVCTGTYTVHKGALTI